MLTGKSIEASPRALVDILSVDEVGDTWQHMEVEAVKLHEVQGAKHEEEDKGVNVVEYEDLEEAHEQGLAFEWQRLA